MTAQQRETLLRAFNFIVGDIGDELIDLDSGRAGNMAPLYQAFERADKGSRAIERLLNIGQYLVEPCAEGKTVTIPRLPSILSEES